MSERDTNLKQDIEDYKDHIVDLLYYVINHHWNLYIEDHHTVYFTRVRRKVSHGIQIIEYSESITIKVYEITVNDNDEHRCQQVGYEQIILNKEDIDDINAYVNSQLSDDFKTILLLQNCEVFKAY